MTNLTNGKLFERIVWTQGPNQVILERFMNAEYSVTDDTIDIEYADSADDDIVCYGPRSTEIELLIDSDDYIEGESLEDLDFEQTEYTLKETA